MSTPKPPKVFVSATSGDLGSVRKLIKDALLKIGCMPIEQADFPPDYRSVATFLETEIGNCDAVLHVVGKRYGAEPNPATLPPGAVRRSYTQLEYDAARKLKKNAFVFICGSNFPYDACDEEPDLKTLLQSAHRETLLQNDLKYEVVATPAECNDKVRQLRLQLEELAQQIRAEHKRQIIAWSAVAGALCVLLVLGLAIWSQLRTTREEVAHTSQTTSKQVGSIDSKVQSLVASDMLTTIAQKAGLDPENVKQLVLQSESSNDSTLEYATKLGTKDRHDAAYALARFVGETALLLENSDCRAAAEAFLIAAREGNKLAEQNKDTAAKLKSLADMEALALRGLDAIRALDSAGQAGLTTLYIDLALERAYSLSKTALSGTLSDAQATMSRAIDQVDDALTRPIEDPVRLSKLDRRRAYYLVQKAQWVGFKEAQALLDEALIASDKSLELLSNTDQPEAKALALSVRCDVRLSLSELVPMTSKRALLGLVEQDGRAGLGVLPKEAPSSLKAELALQLGLAKLELAKEPISAAEESQNFAAAIELLTEAFEQAEEHHFDYVARRAATNLADRAFTSP